MSSLSVDTISNLAGDQRFGPVRMTAQSPSGVATADFTSIPSWVKKVTVYFDQLSNASTNYVVVQLGDSGGLETTGYTGLISAALATSSNAVTGDTTGYQLTSSTAAAGGNTGILTLVNISGNIWIGTSICYASSASYLVTYAAYRKELSGTLDRLRVKTDSAANFDAGSVGVIYE